jgi:hypothetical protein
VGERVGERVGEGGTGPHREPCGATMTGLTRRGVRQRVEETALTGRLALHGAAMMAQEGVHERKRNPGDRAEATNRTACRGGEGIRDVVVQKRDEKGGRWREEGEAELVVG